MSSTPASFSAPKGTHDLLPPGSWTWQRLVRTAMDMFAGAAYGPVETPIFEHTEVFERGVGETTEVVGKQMYTFEDKGGRSLTLRPEGTAPVMRAVLEHKIERGSLSGSLPLKLAYAGPMFRQERPQKGRARQFFQLGIEAIGSDEPAVDAEVIELAWRYFAAVGLPVELRLNSIGHPGDGCRGAYLAKLAGFLRSNADRLAPEDEQRIDTNPMRTFDSKESSTIEVMAEAPTIADHICADCRAHYERVKDLLGSLDVGFEEDPRLVRGLDYYTRTAFEFVAGGLGSQNAVGGGGRYDGLAKALGGPSIPGIGFALGLDRIVLALGEDEDPGASLDAYVVTLGDDSVARGLRLATRIRRAGMSCDSDLGGRSLKAQMKDAGRSGARYAVIVGAEEAAAGRATVKDLSSGEQETIDEQDLEGRLSR